MIHLPTLFSYIVVVIALAVGATSFGLILLAYYKVLKADSFYCNRDACERSE